MQAGPCVCFYLPLSCYSSPVHVFKCSWSSFKHVDKPAVPMVTEEGLSKQSFLKLCCLMCFREEEKTACDVILQLKMRNNTGSQWCPYWLIFCRISQGDCQVILSSRSRPTENHSDSKLFSAPFRSCGRKRGAFSCNSHIQLIIETFATFFLFQRAAQQLLCQVNIVQEKEGHPQYWVMQALTKCHFTVAVKSWKWKIKYCLFYSY